MKWYIWELEIIHHASVSIHTKYKINLAFHKSHVFILTSSYDFKQDIILYYA